MKERRRRRRMNGDAGATRIWNEIRHPYSL